MFETFIFIHSFLVAIAFGFSTATLVCFLSFSQDNQITKDEGITLKILFTVLRSFMWILLIGLTILLYMSIEGGTAAVASLQSPYFYIAHIILIGILFANATCMKRHYLPKIKLIPLQVSAWYTQNISLALVASGVVAHEVFPYHIIFVYIAVTIIVYIFIIKLLPKEMHHI